MVLHLVLCATAYSSGSGEVASGGEVDPNGGPTGTGTGGSDASPAPAPMQCDDGLPDWGIALLGAAAGAFVLLAIVVYVTVKRGEFFKSVDAATATAARALADERMAHEATRLELAGTRAELLKQQQDYDYHCYGLEEASQMAYAALIRERHCCRDLQLRLADADALAIPQWKDRMQDAQRLMAEAKCILEAPEIDAAMNARRSIPLSAAPASVAAATRDMAPATVASAAPAMLPAAVVAPAPAITPAAALAAGLAGPAAAAAAPAADVASGGDSVSEQARREA